MQPPDSRQRWVSFDEARMILRKSEGTLRREIKAGKVEAAQFPRNPDNPADKRSVYRVLIYDPPEPDAHPESGHPPPIRQETPPAASTVPIEDYIAAQQQVIVMHAEVVEAYQRIASLEREAGTLHADANHAQARAKELAEQFAEAQNALQAERAKSWWDKLRGR